MYAINFSQFLGVTSFKGTARQDSLYLDLNVLGLLIQNKYLFKIKRNIKKNN